VGGVPGKDSSGRGNARGGPYGTSLNFIIKISQREGKNKRGRQCEVEGGGARRRTHYRIGKRAPFRERKNMIRIKEDGRGEKQRMKNKQRGKKEKGKKERGLGARGHVEVKNSKGYPQGERTQCSSDPGLLKNLKGRKWAREKLLEGRRGMLGDDIPESAKAAACIQERAHCKGLVPKNLGKTIQNVGVETSLSAYSREA